METSVTIIAICQILFVVVAIAIAVAVFWVVRSFKRLVSQKADEMMERLQPIVDQAKEVAEKANQTVESVSKRIDSIASKAENTADEVTDKVRGVSDRVEQAVTPQVVAAAGAVSTVVKCFEIYRDVKALKYSAEGPKQKDEAEEEAE